MKIYLLKIALFFALMAVIDVTCGYAFRLLTSKAKYGETYKNNYIANICSDDVIILGSSHAARNYVPSVIQDSLGLTCYNCGEPGCGIIPAYARYKMIAERKKPRLVIYEVTPGYDYFIADDYYKYLGRVRQFSNKESVAEMYRAFGDGLEPLRQLSNMYRNNSYIIDNVKNLLVPEKDLRGYGPLYGKLTKEIVAQKKATQVEKDTKSHEIDSLKLTYVEKIFADVKTDGVELICIVSPEFNYSNERIEEKYQPVIALCEKYGFSFINNRNYGGFTGKMDLFQDFGHLNNEGAKKYTASILPILKKSIE